MKKILIYGGSIVVALVLVAWKLNANKEYNEARTAIVRESSSGAVPVLVKKATLTSLDQTFSENGNFEAVNQIELTSEISGRVRELYVREGSVVKAGQAIAKIDNEIFSATHAESQVRLEQAKQNLVRYEQALKSGGVTQKQVDDARMQVETAHAQFVQAGKNVNNAIVKAPVGGVINKRFVEVGTYLALGNKIVEIVDGSALKLVVNISEREVVNVKTGDGVTVTTSVYPEISYEGVVTFVSAKGDASLNYPVEIEIKNIAGKELKAGMYGTARFDIKNSGNGLLIPRAAFQGGVNSKMIFVSENGKAKLKRVVTGQSYGDMVEVRDGLKQDELVIVSGQINLVDGTAITILE
ncbi:MAG: efflux RND transporter periplasmic adaptor subunit [Bacteroidetes bacterium CHB5]|nr:efflux RND transporter periplasmic adaptor subunit [Bacteroidetes bacterium CHB5]